MLIKQYRINWKMLLCNCVPSLGTCFFSVSSKGAEENGKCDQSWNDISLMNESMEQESSALRVIYDRDL